MRGTHGEREYRRAVREGVTVEFESFYVPWQKWFAVKAYPTDAGGISVYFRDITNRKKDEEALRETEKRFRQLADNISQFAWMADEGGRSFGSINAGTTTPAPALMKWPVGSGARSIIRTMWSGWWSA